MALGEEDWEAVAKVGMGRAGAEKGAAVESDLGEEEVGAWEGEEAEGLGEVAVATGEEGKEVVLQVQTNKGVCGGATA